MSRDFFILLMGRLVQVVVSVVSIRAVTHYLDEKELGTMYLALAIVSYFSTAVIAPVGHYYNRHVHSWFEDGILMKRLRSFGIFLFLGSLVLVGLTPLLRIFFEAFNDIPLIEFFLALVLLLIFNTMVGFLPPMLNLLGKSVQFVVTNSMALGFSLLGAILFVVTMKSSAIFWILGQAVGQSIAVLTALFLLWKLVKQSNKEFKLSYLSIKDIWNFSTPLAVSSLFMWLLLEAYKLVIEKTVSVEYLGRLGVGFAITTSIFGIIESLSQQLLLPKFYAEANSGDKESRAKISGEIINKSIPVFVLTTVYVACLAPFIMRILADTKFHEAYIFISFAAIANLFRVLSNMASYLAHGEKKTGKLLLPYIVGSVVTLGGVYLLSSRYNDFNIPGIVSLGFGVTCVAMFLSMKSIVEFKFDFVLLGKSLLFSLPFAIAVPFYEMRTQFWTSFAITGFLGLCYLALNYYFYRQEIASK